MPKNKKTESDQSMFASEADSNSGSLESVSHADSQSFDLAMRELEDIVAQMDGGQMPLEGMLLAYQRGAQLVATCKQKLMQVEQQVKVLDGEVLKVFEGEQVAPLAGSRS